MNFEEFLTSETATRAVQDQPESAHPSTPDTHETSMETKECGETVTAVQVGDRVIVDGVCHHYRGAANLQLFVSLLKRQHNLTSVVKSVGDLAAQPSSSSSSAPATLTWYDGPIARGDAGNIVAIFPHPMRSDKRMVYVVNLDRVGLAAMDVEGLRHRLGVGMHVVIVPKQTVAMKKWRVSASESLFTDLLTVPLDAVAGARGRLEAVVPHPSRGSVGQFVWLVRLLPPSNEGNTRRKRDQTRHRGISLTDTSPSHLDSTMTSSCSGGKETTSDDDRDEHMFALAHSKELLRRDHRSDDDPTFQHEGNTRRVGLRRPRDEGILRPHLPRFHMAQDDATRYEERVSVSSMHFGGVGGLLMKQAMDESESPLDFLRQCVQRAPPRLPDFVRDGVYLTGFFRHHAASEESGSRPVAHSQVSYGLALRS